MAPLADQWAADDRLAKHRDEIARNAPDLMRVQKILAAVVAELHTD
ncbi:MAG: hypothetical protein JO106_00135 [Mycobacterium sp.]|nr:hypothetical protein [Mycobacterium sp.]